MEHHGIIQCDALPVCEVCGNGAPEPGEECDDGNGADTDACLPTCENASCGDGLLWAGVEQCDDGNLQDGDGCESDCTPTPSVCGDGVAQGTEECDGDDFRGETCSTLGAGDFGALTCTAACTVDTALCSDCQPGTPGCRCLRTELAGEENPVLREGGILGNGKYCLDDVSLGGEVRCLENADATDTCHSCTVGEGVWCPCVPQEGCVLGDIEGPATGQPGDTLFCAAACTPGFEDTCDAAPAGGSGYCFVQGATPDDGGMPGWFPDQYCKNVDPTFTCVQQPGQASLCMPGPGPACTLSP